MDKVLRETGTVIDDGLHEIFVNAQIKDSTNISELMSCFMEKNVNNPKFPALSEGVTELKETEGGISSMCQIMQRYEEQARQDGIKLGMKQGHQQGLKQGLKQGLQQGEDITLKLVQKLLDSGRFEDANRITYDRDYYNQVKREFALWEKLETNR